MATSRPLPLDSGRSSREPQLLHFRLRQMFFVVTLLSLLCALLVNTTGVWPLIIVFGSLLIAAHVCGNLIGTRLRDSSQKIYRRRPRDPSIQGIQPEEPFDSLGSTR